MYALAHCASVKFQTGSFAPELTQRLLVDKSSVGPARSGEDSGQTVRSGASFGHPGDRPMLVPGGDGSARADAASEDEEADPPPLVDDEEGSWTESLPQLVETGSSSQGSSRGTGQLPSEDEEGRDGAWSPCPGVFSPLTCSGSSARSSSEPDDYESETDSDRWEENSERFFYGREGSSEETPDEWEAGSDCVDLESVSDSEVEEGSEGALTAGSDNESLFSCCSCVAEEECTARSTGGSRSQPLPGDNSQGMPPPQV